MSEVVFLKFTSDKIQPDGLTFMACSWCRNKTFTVVYQDDKFPMMKCAACGNNLGRMGWADE